MIDSIQNKLLALFILLFPLFFLPITQEFISTNKLFFLLFAVLLLYSLSLANLIFKNKAAIELNLADFPVLFLALAVSLSTIFASSNKIESLLIPTGTGFFLGLTALYFFIKSRRADKLIFEALTISGLVLSVFIIILYSGIFTLIKLPADWQFLTLAQFSPLGSRLDLSLFLMFALLTVLFEFKIRIKKIADLLSSDLILHYLFLMTITLALILSLFGLKYDKNLFVAPLPASVDAAYATISKPDKAFFGVGIDNFPTAFNLVKTPDFNKSDQFGQSVSRANNFLLQMVTETGLFGLITIILIMSFLIYLSFKHYFATRDGLSLYLCLISVCLLIVLIVPSSMILLLLVYLILGVLNSKKDAHRFSLKMNINGRKNYLIFFPIILIGVLILIGLYYLAGRAYLAEIYYKKAINSLKVASSRDSYENQKKAVSLNPYMTRFHISFSQLNLLLANNLVTSSKSKELNLTDRQIVTQLIQQAISEGKTAVKLNYNNSSNWENLGYIYRNIISIVNGADVWAISSYQRAIALDPVNPSLRLNLGGIYYTIKDYENAIKEFQKAANLKSDWPNAYYNLAWAYWDTDNSDQAIYYLKQTMATLQKGSANYTKVATELESFEKQKATKIKTTQPAIEKSSDLSLPQNTNQTILEKLDLP
ncbi:hypothetical protein A3J15_04060 [Candidatus Roizmanbacteria bacterium RIFCSPLOWO2_02_FULL_38_10]|uniref:Uncharacterized protein n=1 Tax=Candidatus Roizmanbacteria bacterium RIFCSPLOWO2_02_FULL_38_10 TaxID=1802074 RepID=A0A1F7JP97_9BACT|nr:MAG: hypothetical protein A3J15_04060 [Candidatus Roizmanbacteria bacterium RIFCSPLOWO2_02_FULL_38_10]